MSKVARDFVASLGLGTLLIGTYIILVDHPNDILGVMVNLLGIGIFGLSEVWSDQ